MSEKRELPNSLVLSIDLEKEMLLNESSKDWGNRLGWSGMMVPPGSRADIGIECMTQCILRGPRVPNTFSSYEIWAMLKLPEGTFGETFRENRRLEHNRTGRTLLLCGGWES